MGYTHYWRQTRDFSDEEWASITKATLVLIDSAEVIGFPVRYESDDTSKPALVDDETIRFKGIWEGGCCYDRA